MIPKIYLKHQETLFEETITKNGIRKDVNYVVKNTPFTIKLGLENMPHGIHFKNSSVECSLLYDMEGNKEVEAIKQKPLEYVVFPSDDGMTCKIELRVKVLTTQLQGSFFIVRVVMRHGDLELSCNSRSIKAVSKPAQIRRKIAERDGIVIEPKRRNRKRKRNEDVSLDDVLKVQAEHTDMLKNLISMVSKKQSPYYYPIFDASNYATPYIEAKPAVIPQNMYIQHPSTTTVKEELCPEDKFKEKLKELVDLYGKINPDGRKDKVRKIVSGMEQTSTLAELRSALSPDTNQLGTNAFSNFDNGNDDFDLSMSHNNLLGFDQFSPSSLESLNEFCLDFIQGNL